MSSSYRNPVVHLFSQMWRTADAKGRRSIVRYLVMFGIANSFSMTEPLVVGLIFNLIQEQGISGSTLPSVLLYLSLLVGITVAFWIFHGPARIIEQKNGFRVFQRKKVSLVSHVLSLPLSWHSDHHSGDTIDKVEKGTKALYDFSTDVFMIFENIIRFVIAFCILVYFNIHAGYLLLILVTVTILLILKFDVYLEGLLDKINAGENTVSAKVYDIIGNITTVIMLRAEKQSLGTLSKEIEKPFATFVQWAKVNEVKWFLVSILASLMQFLVLGSYVISAVSHGQAVLVGTVYLLYSYVHNIVGVFYNVAWLYSELVAKRSKLANAQALEALPLPKKRRTPSPLTKGRWRHIGLRHVFFSYKGEETIDEGRHLTDVSFDMAKGERIAFIGESGSGKTTMLKVLRGLYPIDSGEVLSHGKPVAMGLEALSDLVALVPQEPEIFATTIEENITLGLPYTTKEVLRFSDVALFTPVANRLPKQFASQINEKGVNLSGGEKQRLALARGLLFAQNRDILLLDEPTSSIDAKNEKEIYANIFNVFAGKTIISTVHRLNLLPLFDTIYYFKRGRIIASGTYLSLQHSSKEFAQLWRKYHKSHKT